MAGKGTHAPALGRPAVGGAPEAAPRVADPERVRALVEENRRLRELVGRMDASIAFRRLDYLFRVVEHAERFGQGFVAGCVSEIEGSLTVPAGAAGGVEAGGDGGGGKE